MIVRFALLAILIWLLVDCAAPQIIKVPTLVACKQDIGPDPAPIATYATLKAQSDIRERLKLALEQIIQDVGRLGQYRAALSAC